MSSLMKNLIKSISRSISRLRANAYITADGEVVLRRGCVWAEDFLNELDGGDLRKRGADIFLAAREKSGSSRREAAIRLGITPKELKLIEKGLKKPSKRLAVKMAGLYRVGLKTLWKYAI